MSGAQGVAIGGFMGVGKSTVGRALAVRLGLPFVDLDAVLTQRFGPIPEQFETEGEAMFRAREAALIAELCDGEARVVATGGGAWVSERNRGLLGQSYRTVVLTAPLDVLGHRVSGAGRPLWDESIQARYEARAVAYADAELILDARSSVDALVEEIAAWLNR